MIYPYFTNDGSVGLYNNQVDDIYHSTYGALSEAYEKFILPVNFKKYFSTNNQIKIFDICYGIGYNTKSFLNFYLENCYNDTIGSDNNKYIDKLYTNNCLSNIFIHAVDTDKNLVELSPFFISGKNNVMNKNLDFNNTKITKLCSGMTKTNYKLKKEVNIILINKLKSLINLDNILLANKKYDKFLDRSLIAYLTTLKNNRGILIPIDAINVFLHNIYYRYISTSHKNASNTLKNLNLDFNISIEDARKVIKNDNNMYNVMFLDAFTPSKCPCLWSLDFFKVLFEHLEPSGLVITYSSSANIRNALLNAGFKLKKIYSKSMNKYSGTAAFKSDAGLDYLNSEIVHDLSKFDLGLLKTKAGIFYRDKNLNFSNEEILAAHKNEVENSTLMSTTKYKKLYAPQI